MFNSIVLLALVGVGEVAAPSLDWQRDYGVALEKGAAVRRPLAVFIGSGAEGWKAMSQDGDLGAAARRVLQENYICLYVDAAEAEGKKLSAKFEAGQLPTLVLSDRTRAYQAHRSTGALAEAELTRTLQRSVNLEVPIADGVIRSSSYQPTTAATPTSAPTTNCRT